MQYNRNLFLSLFYCAIFVPFTYIPISFKVTINSNPIRQYSRMVTKDTKANAAYYETFLAPYRDKLFLDRDCSIPHLCHFGNIWGIRGQRIRHVRN
jgi:hypothetical protein